MAYAGVLNDLRACIELRQPERMPAFALGLEFDLVQAGLNNAEGRTDVDKVVRATLEAIRRFGYDWAVVFPDDYVEFEPLGLEMNDAANTPAIPNTYLPMDRETLRTFRLPDPQEDMRMPIHLEMIRQLKTKLGDTACVVGRIAAPFSTLALVYGIDAALTTMLIDPDLVRDNLRHFIQHQTAFGKAQLEAGADLFWLGDCVAASNFISPDQFSEFAFDAAAEVAEPLRAMGGYLLYHAGETSVTHLKLETQLPISAVNVGEGVSIAALKEELGARVCLAGNFDPILLRDGTPEQIAHVTGKMIRENAPGGGYIFCTGEGVMANTPAGNVVAMMTEVAGSN